MTERTRSLIVAVVDDDPGVLRSLEYLLESADYEVRLFNTGRGLVDSGCLQEIDCLISDIDMPGMEGYELVRLVRASRPRLPVILITGFPDALNRVYGLAGGNPQCFTKPFAGPHLLAAVSESIQKAAR
jgi:FixJ family two-component response regulator